MMEIRRLASIGTFADLGLTSAEAKQFLWCVQQAYTKARRCASATSWPRSILAAMSGRT